MKGQRPQERWIDVTGNHRRHLLPRTVLFALVRITGYRVLAGGRIIEN